MKELYYGYYATCIYLPLSLLSRRWRRFSRRLRGKHGRFSQATQLPEVLWKQCATSHTPRVYEHKKENGNVRISELGILCALAAGCKDSTNIFEIGTFDGRTTLNIALNAPSKCKVYTLDIPPDQETKFELDKGERHMVDKHIPGSRYEKYRSKYPAAISNIHQLFGDSATFDFSPYKDSCSLVFVDGSHAYDYVMSDTRAAMSMVVSGGVVIWHDYGIWEGVTKALEKIELLEQYCLRTIRGTSLVYWRKE